MRQSSPVNRAIALQHSKGPEAEGERAEKKRGPEVIFNVAQRRRERWPPGMAGHKKPAHRPACLRLGQAQRARLTGTGVLLEELKHRNVAALLQASDQEMPTLTFNMGQPFRRQVRSEEHTSELQ